MLTYVHMSCGEPMYAHINASKLEIVGIKLSCNALIGLSACKAKVVKTLDHA